MHNIHDQHIIYEIHVCIVDICSGRFVPAHID